METQHIESEFCGYITDSIEKIDAESYLNASKNRPEDFTRKRKMTFPELIRFMLCRRKGSTQNELEHYFEQIKVDRLMTQQAFSEARMKIQDSAFSMLFYNIAGYFYRAHEHKTWRGYRLLAIDGSKIALPDVALLGRIYGTMGADSSSPTAQASVCYDILNDNLVDALIEPLACDERTLALEHIKNLEKSFRQEKELIIADRGYPSFEIFHELRNEKIDFLMRVKRGFNVEIDAQESPDGQVTLRKNGYEPMSLRVIKLVLPSGEIETLITTLEDDSLTIDDFKTLYFLRWPVETKYDIVKNKLQIENFTGCSKLAVRQDFYATMYLANMAAAARRHAQPLVDAQRKGKNNKYQYQVNVNHEIGVLKDHLIYALTSKNPAKEAEKILWLLAKRVCPVKPTRSPKRSPPRKAKFHANHRANC